MNRFNEKIKDLIEVQPYTGLKDFTAEPSETLSKYHFTDITSELMVNWLDSLVKVQSGFGEAKALAGYRGVGKSHFLATFGAIVANPDLRSKITDQHVAAGAQHLKRKRYPTAFVRRGSQPTLLAELRFSVSNCFGVDEAEIPSTVEYLIEYVTGKISDTPFVFIIDTTLDRESRVSRDDGALLGELANLAKDRNIFIGVALDDDITDANGMNSAIAGSYMIDYLDQEHLYQIINTHIFPKHRQTQALIKQIYTDYKTIFPGFRWSEQRFNSLFPLHPSILEAAPFVRLYIQDFAVLDFASAAGAKILGRPANSLIALDELFDNVETDLRRSEDLTEAFEAFDRLSSEINSKVPVMQRLQAKLILKAWFILSLDGDGTTAAEVAAAMLIFDERNSAALVGNIENLLEMFVSAMPLDVRRREIEGRENRYSFKLSKKDTFNSRLDESILAISDEVVPALLRRIAKDKFADWHFSVESSETEKIDWADCQIVWRGGVRRARLWWDWDAEYSLSGADKNHSEFLDLEILIESAVKPPAEISDDSKAVWQVAALRADEIDTLKKLQVLLSDTSLREENPEQVNAVLHTHFASAEKIWTRVFLQDSVFNIGDFKFKFPGAVSETQTLGEIFSALLDPFFESNFPSHPAFERPLLMNDVSKLVNDLFSGARVAHENVQDLAEVYALPLGLVNRRGENFLLQTEEALAALPWSEKIFELLADSAEEYASLSAVYKILRDSPFGLVREAQHLILGALVAQRKIEFITSKGDRINKRSLDLKILWDDIEGVARTKSVEFDSKKILGWIGLFVGIENLSSLDDPEILSALSDWLENWKTLEIIQGFQQMPDEELNTRIWYFSADIEKTFAAAAETIESILEETISLEEGFQRIAESFYESEIEFRNQTKKLNALTHLIEGAALRGKIRAYLSVCEHTDSEEIEELRLNLWSLLETNASTVAAPSAEKNTRIEELWFEFQLKYSEFFAYRHDSVMKSHRLQEKFEDIYKSAGWWEFENLSKLPVFRTIHRREIEKITEKSRELGCPFDVRRNLETNPFCACSFSLAAADVWENLPEKLSALVEAARRSYRRTLRMLGQFFIESIESHRENIDSSREAFEELSEMFASGAEIEIFSPDHLVILREILENAQPTLLLPAEFPPVSELETPGELYRKLENWFGELPNEPVLLKFPAG